MVHFGIITPTYKRAKFLPAFIQNVRRQTYSNWTLAIVHDGPGDREVAETVRRSASEDRRIHYWKTSVHHGDMGNTPRRLGIENLREGVPKIDYVLFWDDDNYFFRGALTDIDKAIEDTGKPDLLLVPIKHKWRSLPLKGVPLRAFTMGNIDTANLCVKKNVAIQHFEKSQRISDSYHQDFYFYRSICDDDSTKVCLANISNIGCYDGLRLWTTLRWRVYPRPLHVYDTTVMRQLRRVLPR